MKHSGEQVSFQTLSKSSCVLTDFVSTLTFSGMWDMLLQENDCKKLTIFLHHHIQKYLFCVIMQYENISLVNNAKLIAMSLLHGYVLSGKKIEVGSWLTFKGSTSLLMEKKEAMALVQEQRPATFPHTRFAVSML